MGEEDLSPVLFIEILILDRSFGDLIEVHFSCLIGAQQLNLFINHGFEILDMGLSFFSLSIELFCQFIVYLHCSVLSFSNLMSFLFENGKLLAKVRKFLVQIILPLIIEYFISFVTPFHIEQYFLLGYCFLNKSLLLIKAFLKKSCFVFCLSDLILIFILKDVQFPHLFLQSYHFYLLFLYLFLNVDSLLLHLIVLLPDFSEIMMCRVVLSLVWLQWLHS